MFSILITVMLLSTTLIAQSSVKIKSRVEIKPGQGIINPSINESTQELERPDFWILPRSGTIELSYWFFSRENPIPENSYIVVTVGSKIYHNNMFPYLKGEQFYLQYDECHGCDPSLPIYFYDPDDSSQKIFFMGHANDTVRMSYYTSERHNLNTYDYGYIFNYHSPVTIVPCPCPGYSFTHQSSPEHIEGTFVYRDEIMLGESKYLQAYLDGNEIGWASPWTDTPDHVGAETPGVTFTVEPLNGSKCGVYWEQLTEPGKRDMIRLIGRYWEKDSTFAVKVTAKCNGDEVDYWYPIYTMAPDRLLTPGQKPTYEKTLDVFNNERNIDSICIYYGGKNGIPPHFIKAQMAVEAATYNFGGSIGWGFAPSYRYEPYTTQFSDWIINRTNNPFFVKDNPVNDPPVPPHQYVSYPYPNKFVWDMIYDHSQLENPNSDNIYGTRNIDHTMSFVYDSKTVPVIKEYFNMLKYFKKLNIEDIAAADSARINFVDYIKYRWHGGATTIKAQTRIAASYGLLQLQYREAVKEEKYKEDRDHLPENMNITDIGMVLSMQRQKRFLIEHLSPGVESGNNWSSGFEQVFWDYVYGRWNHPSVYRNKVKARTNLYLPQNN
jgi:hypothetical protein